MLSLAATQRVLVHARPIDFRKAHDGLCALVRDAMRDDPFSGGVFVFWNTAKDRVKLLVWDRNGFWMLYKRLERGRFPFDLADDATHVEIDRARLSMLLDGIEWKNAKRSSRFTSHVGINARDGSRVERTPG
jgi:transposase